MKGLAARWQIHWEAAGPKLGSSRKSGDTTEIKDGSLEAGTGQWKIGPNLDVVRKRKQA